MSNRYKDSMEWKQLFSDVARYYYYRCYPVDCKVSSINRVLRNLTTETHRTGGGGHHFFTSSHVYDKFGSLFGGSQPWTHRAGHPWYASGPGGSAGAGAGVFHGTDMAAKLSGGDVAFHTSHVNHAHQMSSLVAGPLHYGAVDRKCESF